MTIRLRLAALIVMVIALAGCSGGTTAPVTASPATAPASTVPAAVQTGAPSSGPKVLQTDTTWGRIWDGVPAGFPTYPGATTDEEAPGGPASAVFVVEGHAAKDVAGFLQTQLKDAGYTEVGSSEPLEDGSVELDMTGSKGCKIQVTVTPTGGLTSIRVFYGAGCPLS